MSQDTRPNKLYMKVKETPGWPISPPGVSKVIEDEKKQ